VSLSLSSLRRFAVLALLSVAVLGLSACGTWQTHEEELETASVERAYEICREAVDKGNYERAVRDLKRLTGRFPFGNYSELAQLDLAFSQAKLGDSDEALATTNRFIKTYPTQANADYAYYLRGLINSERQNSLVDKLAPQDRATHDQKTNKQAFLDFGDMLKRYPESKYAPDARARMIVLRGVLADSELKIAQYYFRRGVYVGAISRAKLIIESYQGTAQSYDALAILTQSYQALGQDQLASDTESVLKLNAPEHAYFTGKRNAGRWWRFGL
jgi:outer membrane protein assembly factor BamD